MGRRARERKQHDHRGRASAEISRFSVVVGAGAASSVDLRPEIELIKAALLYGDEVTVMSPLLTMLLRVEQLGNLGPEQIVELVRRVAPYLLPDDEAETLLNGMDQIDDLLRPSGDRSGAGRIMRREVMRRLGPARALLADAVDGIARRSGVAELSRARSDGLLKVQSLDPGDALDLVASCAISAKLAESGQREESPHTARLVGTYVDRLAEHLEAGRAYLMFDNPTAGLVDAGLREGLFKAAPGPSGRAAQAMTASGLLARLPTFPQASVDEVIDIRADLDGPLSRFRAAMVSASRGFSIEPWDAAFEDELHDFWIETVSPAVQELGEEVRENSSLLATAAGIAGTAKATVPGLTLIGAGLASRTEALKLAGETAAVAVPLLDALRSRRRQAADLRMKPFYFLYAVDAALT
jgi:hypothetical protein